HTHGYVRASTLNDLFSSLPGGPNSGLSFTAGKLSKSQLHDVNLDTAAFDDGHQFSWKVNGKDGTIDFGGTGIANNLENVDAELNGIIGDIELALDAQYDKDYAD